MGSEVGDERLPGPTVAHTNIKQLLNPGVWKSAGPVQLQPRSFKNSWPRGTVGPLMLIFNKSLKTGVVPEGWEKANVVPVF